MNCALLSISNTEGWFIDDHLLIEPLQKLNWQVHTIPWNKPTDWNLFDIVVIRSPWDYQDHLNEFMGVLNCIQESKAILLNSLELVMWNINKNYLFDLQKKGIELVPSIKVKALKKSDIIAAFDRFEVAELIVKPIIGANADDTFRINQGEFIDFKRLESTFKDRECMIQPFMQNILKEGEYSLMYFQGKLSHTILKTVKTGDFRVQEEHGGGVIPIEKPDALLLSSANKAMSALPERPFYARVDMVRSPQNSFALMEVELIEPCLYFRFDDESAHIFARCIDDYWNQHKTSC